MVDLNDSGASAHRGRAAFFFWFAPFLVATIYSLTCYEFSPRPNRHAFEQGVLGLGLALGFVAALCSVNLAGFALAILMIPEIDARSSRALYLWSGISGVSSLLGFALLSDNGIVSSSDGFWFGYYVVGTVTISWVISVILLTTSISMGFLKCVVER